MKIVCFLDLDDTIFQTGPKCPPGEAVRPVAFRRDGTPLSFMTDRQHTLVESLLRLGTVIPTTARSLEAFRRVDLPFGHGAAILDFGGAVLAADGSLDKTWDAHIRPLALEFAAELRALQRFMEETIRINHLGAYARVIVDFDMPLYAVAKHAHGDASKLLPLKDALEKKIDPARFFLHSNDNNLSLVPRFLGKEGAVRHVLQHQFADEPTLTIGVGDSLTDAPFLKLCDYSLMPRDCQLARNLS